MSGNGLAQLLQLLALLVLARIYTPDSFGLLGEVQSIASLVAVIMTLQLHNTIPLSDGKIEVEKRIASTHIIIAFIFIIILIPFILNGYILATLLALILSLINTYTSYWVYKGAFKSLSFFYILRAIFIIGTQLIFSYFSKDGLVYGAIIGELFALIYLVIKNLFNELTLKYSNYLSKQTIRSFLKNEKEFVVFGTIQEFLSVATFFIPLFLFVKIYGENIGGQYAMANRLVWAPVVLLTSSLAQVFYNRFAQNNDFSVLDKKLWIEPKYLILLLIVPIVYEFFKDYLSYILGNGWKLAADMITYMILSGIFFIFSIPYRVVFRVTKALSILMYIELSYLIITILLFMYISIDAFHILTILVFLSFFQFFLIYLYSKKLVHSKIKVKK